MIRKSTFAATFAKLFGTAAVATTLCASPAQAGVLDFESGVDFPLVTSDFPATIGNYYLEGAGGGISTIGTTADMCDSSVACPGNNANNYLASLDDAYIFLSMTDGSAFKLSSVAASFVGFANTTYPGVAGLLQVTAFNGNTNIGSLVLNLAGPAGGAFNFANYNLSALGAGNAFTTVRFVTFGCEVGSTSCTRATNQAGFALDDITTYVPEPGSFALMGLGLLGLGVFARRRAV